MATRICLDTTMLVDVLRGKEQAVVWVREAERNAVLATTQINAFELFYGAFKAKNPNNQVKAAEVLLNRLVILNLSVVSARNAGETLAHLEKEGRAIEFRDLLIGNIALAEGYSVKTDNKNHFSRIPGLLVE